MYFVLARIDPTRNPIKSESVEDYVIKTLIANVIAEEEKIKHIERVAAIVESGGNALVPFGNHD